MTRFTDAAHEIKDALDREVGRRFDAQSLAATLGSAGSRGGHAGHEGPLQRVPALVQWIGVAAAVIAATLGLRSLYHELTSPAAESSSASTAFVDVPQPSEENITNVSEPESASASLAEERAEPAPSTSPRKESGPPRVVESDVDTSAMNVNESEPAAASAPRRSRAPSPAPSHAAPPPPAQQVVGVDPSRPARDAERDDALSRLTSTSLVGVVFPGLPGPTLGGVRVVSLDLGGQPLVADVRDVPEVRATLVAIRGAGARFRRNDAPPAVAAGREARQSAADSGTVRDVPSTSTSSSPQGVYYVRPFFGSVSDRLPEDEHGLLGKGLGLVPLREWEMWGDDVQGEFLRKTFALRTIVGLDGARIVASSEASAAEASLVAGVGGNVYEISVRAAPGDVEGEHRLDVRFSRKFLRRGQASGTRDVGASLQVRNGHVAVLCVPESLLTGEGPRSRGENMAFVALSPLFAELAPPDAREKHAVEEHPTEPPILIDSIEPQYPDEARRLGVQGKVVIKAVIRTDGSVDGVQVVDLPDMPGAEYLIEAASTAVRKWRYLPARLHGEPVHVHVTLTLVFRTRSMD